MIEKAIIFEIQRASLHDGPGIRTTVFLKGCPLDCVWCHNPEATKAEPQLYFYEDRCKLCGSCQAVCPNKVHTITDNEHRIDFDACMQCGSCVDACLNNALKIVGKEMTIDEVMKEVLKDVDFYKRSGGGVTLSGGEPLYQFGFAKELLKRCRELGINTCIETSGFVSPAKFKQILPLLDVLLFDYKISESDSHIEYTGVPNQLILENLHTAHRFNIPIYLRCPIIPGVNDIEFHFADIAELSEKLPKLKAIEILPYHDMGNSKRISVGRTETLTELKTVTPDIAQKWLEQLRLLGCTKAIIG